MSSLQNSLFIITPIFEDVAAARRLFAELAAQPGQKPYVVAVDDGSVKEPVQPALLEAAGLQGAVLRLRRNVGHQKAIAIGLGYVAGEIAPGQLAVVMDSDGEDLPSSIAVLLQHVQEQGVDVAVAMRKSRIETLKFKTFYAIYKRFFRIITGRSISFGNFMALRAGALKRLAVMSETSIHVASAVLASKLRIKICSIDRGPRYAGQSKMNFVGLVLHGFKGLMVFAEDVLVRVGLASALIGVLSLLGGFTAIGLKAIGYSTPGWFSVALGILVLIFLQTGALSLMTLMLTGVMRSGAVATPLSYHDFVDEIFLARPAAAKA